MRPGPDGICGARDRLAEIRVADGRVVVAVGGGNGEGFGRNAEPEKWSDGKRMPSVWRARRLLCPRRDRMINVYSRVSDNFQLARAGERRSASDVASDGDIVLTASSANVPVSKRRDGHFENITVTTVRR